MYCWKKQLIVILLLSYPLNSFAGIVAEQDIKAQFILNFIKYSEFYKSEKETTICTIPGDITKAYLQDRAYKMSTKVNVLEVALRSNLHTCNAIYLPMVYKSDVGTLIKKTYGEKILTISDEIQFVKMGGIVAFEIVNGQTLLAVNEGALRESGVVLSPDLLNIMQLVR